jgi:hypothetical protein
MSSENKKDAARNSLAAFGRQHLKSLEHRIQKCQIDAQRKGWNYSDFVAHLLEIIVVLRLREERKGDSRGK